MEWSCCRRSEGSGRVCVHAVSCWSRRRRF